MGKPAVEFRLPSGVVRRAVGREAETLLALVAAGPRGITSLECFLAGWAVRLSAYIFDLRRMGVLVRMEREPHEGGRHGRYYISGHVEIVHRSELAGKKAA